METIVSLLLQVKNINVCKSILATLLVRNDSFEAYAQPKTDNVERRKDSIIK